MKSHSYIRKKSRPQYNLVVCAHPDDETIYFTGPLLQIKDKPWIVACATDANADGQGQIRKNDFISACQKLNVYDLFFFDLPDIYEKRLSLSDLISKLEKLPDCHNIYTHGPLGEYGHPHHQDVSFSVHSYFKNKKVMSVAYNCYAEKTFHLTKKQFKLKCHILSEIYKSETQRFLNLLPATTFDSYCSFHFKEVEALYNFFALNKELSIENLKKTIWLKNYLKHSKTRHLSRIF